MNIWHILKLAPTKNERNIKRAYAIQLKQTNPEDNPLEFERLRTAYETALAYAGPDNDKINMPDTNIEEHTSTSRITEPLPHTDNASKHREQLSNESAKIVEKHINELSNRILDYNDAIDYLEKSLKSTELINLDIRQNFEAAVAHILISNEKIPSQTIASIAKIFHWDSDMRHLETADPHAAYYITDRINAKRAFDELITQKKSVYDLRLAARILTGKYNVWSFRLKSIWYKNKEQTLKCIEQLRYTNPALLQFEIDPRIIQWWEKAANQVHFGVEQVCYSFLIAIILQKKLDIHLSSFALILLGWYLLSKIIGIRKILDTIVSTVRKRVSEGVLISIVCFISIVYLPQGMENQSQKAHEHDAQITQKREVPKPNITYVYMKEGEKFRLEGRTKMAPRSHLEIVNMMRQGKLDISPQALKILRKVRFATRHTEIPIGFKISMLTDLKKAALVDFAFVSKGDRKSVVRGFPNELYIPKWAKRVIAYTHPQGKIIIIRNDIDSLTTLHLIKQGQITKTENGIFIQLPKNGKLVSNILYEVK